MIDQLREQFTAFWKNQSSTRKATLITLTSVTIVAIVLFIRWANTPSYEVAFSGLSETDAGLIVEQLQTSDIPFQLQGSGTILVPADDVYTVRLQMAKDGLPQGGSVGYELFSGTSLGMTEFTQRINYQRALEGELERTIGSLQTVDAVRVHIVTPEKSLLTSQQDPTTASVTVRVGSGQTLSSPQVKSITHLVASSVEGLTPENVVVVDINGNLLASGQSDDSMSGSAAAADTHRAAEVAYAMEIENNINALLDSVLGPNSSVVKASVLMNWTEKQITTQAFDPETEAIRSSQVINENYSANGDAAGGIPGAETNLPEDETMLTTTEASSSDYTRTEEIFNYEVTQTETLELVSPGTVSKISLSVMVDGITDTAELETLRTTIAAAAGIDAVRGDVLAVESLDFDHSYFETQAEEIEQSEKTAFYWQIGEIAAAVLILAAILWYIQRMLANLRLKSSKEWTPVFQPVSEMALSDSMAGVPVSERILQPESTGPQKFEDKEQGQVSQSIAASVKKFEKVQPKEHTIEEKELQKQIAHMAQENPSSIAEIIHLWLSEDE
ncbi:MAG: flagellar M-ring protein FliF [Anaerolineales bacterium]|nr:flagellar M-ring protein FliF [Anaerolineales bacterium]